MAYGINTDVSAYNFGMNSNTPYYTPPATQVPAITSNPALVNGATTIASGVITPQSLAALSASDPLNSAMVGTGAFGQNTDGTLNNLATPDQAGWFKSTFMNKGGGLNIGNLTSLLGSIGGIYGAMKSYGLAKDQLNFSKESFRTNIENQRKSYNTALEDRVAGRYSDASRDTARDQAYLDRNRL